MENFVTAVLLCASFWIPIVSQAAEINRQSALTILEPEKATAQDDSAPLLVELKESERGLEFSLQFKHNDGKDVADSGLLIAAGGEIDLDLDGIIVHRQSYSGEDIATSHTFPFSTIHDGTHVIRCKLRTALGQLFKTEISFQLNTSPTIEVEMAMNKLILFDPLVTIGFIDKENEVAGHLEVHLDELPIAIVELSALRADFSPCCIPLFPDDSSDSIKQA